MRPGRPDPVPPASLRTRAEFRRRRARPRSFAQTPARQSWRRPPRVKIHRRSAVWERQEELRELRFSQIHADNLLVVAGVHTAIGEGGMRPDDLAAAGGLARLEHMGPVDFLKAF